MKKILTSLLFATLSIATGTTAYAQIVTIHAVGVVRDKPTGSLQEKREVIFKDNNNVELARTVTNKKGVYDTHFATSTDIAMPIHIEGAVTDFMPMDCRGNACLSHNIVYMKDDIHPISFGAGAGY